ncbi:MAG: hypothetical protein A2122_01435 [Candidatus Liptonbacteria bacterium GWB1_49_6]|uniref:D-alanyl-D-alanine carboxypeptidase-like core domain-containing protein n=1 Tax=Candidatus Liptonbacteria bacterium GWB1_49_6 TaxID=1798644 RepID=A0A1G2C682_9BACT|nr:MAG: hypothetical protein A2122_01435 [Candidatus Liptonbacteria bacterium GWB1_49_6]
MVKHIFRVAIPPKYLTAGGIILAAVLVGFGGYRYWTLYRYNNLLEERFAESENTMLELRVWLVSSTRDNADLTQILEREIGKNNLFESQIQDISGTVGALKKLSEVDRELLKKYSKVYFLNENYVPKELTSVDAQYLFNKTKPQLIHSRMLPFLARMLDTAKQEGIELQIVSAYRSFYGQQSVKTGYEITYGAGTANQFSAEQGYSEHQLGTAVDVTDPKTKGLYASFSKSASYAWLLENAHRFGFILSYPKSNSYYTFEPWHWRFVGVALAGALHDKNEYFYNMNQTEIDKYLISFFD